MKVQVGDVIGTTDGRYGEVIDIQSNGVIEIEVYNVDILDGGINALGTDLITVKDVASIV